MLYKIVKVSEQAPKEVNGTYGVLYYHKLMLEGHDKPVSVGKKTSMSFKVGDTLEGDIVPTEYEADKFKAAPKSFTPKTYAKDPKEQLAIQKQTALKAAVEHMGSSIDNMPNVELVLTTAQAFYEWLKGEQ